MTILTRLQDSPQVDLVKLHSTLKQLDDLARRFIDSSKKIGHPLREIELLNNLRLHLVTPGGGCHFDIPVYHHWLQQPVETLQDALKNWLAEFDAIRIASSLILQLVREASGPQIKTAEHGFYQELLDPQVNLRLVRVLIPQEVLAFPEISIGRHFLSIRFFSPSIQERPAQYLEHISFYLTHCNA
jgi:cell division protein ZapD